MPTFTHVPCCDPGPGIDPQAPEQPQSLPKLAPASSVYSRMTALGLRCRTRPFSSCAEWGSPLVTVRGLLAAAASLVVEHGL